MVAWKIANSMIFPFKLAYVYRIRRMAMYNAYLRDPDLRSSTHLGCLKIVYPFISYMAYKPIGFPSFSL